MSAETTQDGLANVGRDGLPVVPTIRPFAVAPDEDDDPVVAPSRPSPASPVAATRAAPTAPRPRRVHEFAVPDELPVAVPRRPRGVQTIAVNFKFLPEFKQLLEDVSATTGATQTEVLESALLLAYGREQGSR